MAPAMCQQTDHQFKIVFLNLDLYVNPAADDERRPFRFIDNKEMLSSKLS